MGELVELSTFVRKPREKVIPDTLTVASFQEGKNLFLLNCRVKNLSKGTVRVLRVFFHFLSEEGYLSSDPCEKIQIPKVQKKIIKPLSETDIQSLLSLPDVTSFTGLRDYLIMLIFLDNGKIFQHF